MKFPQIRAGIWAGALLAMAIAATNVRADDDLSSLVRLEYWNFNVSGDATVHGSQTNVDDSSHVINRNNGGVVLYGDKRFMNGGMNLDLFIGRERLSKQVSDSESADLEADYSIMTFNGYFPVIDRDFQDPDKLLKVDAMAGLRGIMNTYKLEFNPYDQYNSKNRSDVASWVDGCLGLRVISQFSHRFGMELYGDAGGFGIGSGSELSVLARLSAVVKMSDAINFVAGYRVMDIKSENQSGDRPTEFDIQMRGFTLGVEGRF